MRADSRDCKGSLAAVKTLLVLSGHIENARRRRSRRSHLASSEVEQRPRAPVPAVTARELLARSPVSIACIDCAADGLDPRTRAGIGVEGVLQRPRTNLRQIPHYRGRSESERFQNRQSE